VCYLLSVSHAYNSEALTEHTLAFIKKNASEVMKTKGWANLLKKPDLVNLVVKELAGLMLKY
jgi:hypothetical protein